MSPLAEQLKQYKNSFDASTPADILETINRSISLFQSNSVCSSCLPVGAKIPGFNLRSLSGEMVSSETLLANGPLVIVFIRGGWCPYCILEMQAWQRHYEASFESFNIVAISPEIPEYTSQVKQENNIGFPILIDENMDYAEKLGLIWQLDEEMKALLLKWNIDLTERTQEKQFQLPVPATFVIGQDHTIHFRFIEEDYTLRAEPAEVLKVYNKLL